MGDKQDVCRNLSVLIPVYNYVCAPLVDELRRQVALYCTQYEIIVADDGSTDTTTILQNTVIEDLPCCRFLRHEYNMGRSAIRNYLAHEAKYDFLLFLDCDVFVPSNDFILRYLQAPLRDVVCGGVLSCDGKNALRGNLRHIYESHFFRYHTVKTRSKHPYHSFRTTCFLVRRSVMLSHPFDERIRTYGYEDVLFGKSLQESDCNILHIDNPVIVEEYEDNVTYVQKVEEALCTLQHFRKELRQYSSLTRLSLSFLGRILIPFSRFFFTLFGRTLRNNLTGEKPRLWAFYFYKLLFFLSLTNNNEN